jgi:hypothetical protein
VPALRAQGAAPETLPAHLLGRWTGVLEYRDYKEPAGSDKRVELPTWFQVSTAPEGLWLDYTYDDGPGKTVKSRDTLVLDLARASYRVVSTDAVAENYTVAGLDKLRDGYGVLLLTGPGKENDKPVEVRITWTVRRNLLSWLKETRPAGTQDAFAFRDRYVFTRAEAPAAAAKP